MKLLLLTFISLFLTTGCTDVNAEIGPEAPVTGEPAGNQKILILYFSHTGNTRTIAGYIHEATESDIMEIQTVEKYTEDYNTLLAQARQEVAGNYSPAISTTVDNIQEYDIIFIGYPIWVETAAPPVRTFLNSHDLDGKKIVPFCTSGTSSAERSYQLIKTLCPGSAFLESIQIRRGTYDTAKERVQEWLEKIGITAAGN